MARERVCAAVKNRPAKGAGSVQEAASAREVALDLLLELEKGGQYSDRLMKAVQDQHDDLDVREKAFIKRAAEGTLERQLELDYYLDAYASIPVKKMKPLIRCLLRLGVYQLLYMESVPDHAVCSEACKLAGKRGFGSLRGFVNGILRNISRNKDRLPLPDEREEPLRHLSVKYSLPEWLVEYWMEAYGRTITLAMLAAQMEIRPVSLRFRDGLPAEEIRSLSDEMERGGAVVRESVYLPSVRLIEHTGGVGRLPGFSEGKWMVQDVSSALAVELAGIRETDFVMDVCAAPGGKSLLAAQRADRVLSRDISEEKAGLIRENRERMRADNIEIQVYDARRFDEVYEGKADVVLLDVPCSGLGVMGRKRDIRRHVSREGMESLCALQKELAGVCSRYVKPGGTLLYSTCTVNPAENEEMLCFLVRELGLEPVSIEEELPGPLLCQKRETQELRAREGRDMGLTLMERKACIQLLPGFMEADGFFIAKVRRPSL